MTTTETIEIEVCGNIEWWRTFGPFDGMSDDETEAGISAVVEAMEDAAPVADLASGQRSTCHGWNGANTFARKFGGIGTFSKMTDAEWDAITDAFCRATDAAKK